MADKGQDGVGQQAGVEWRELMQAAVRHGLAVEECVDIDIAFFGFGKAQGAGECEAE